MPALDLKAVREAIYMAAAHARFPDHLKVYKAQLDALDSHLSLSEYDRAVSDLAKYLPDGWVAQDKDCTITTLFKSRPGTGEWAWTCVDSELEISLEPLNFPRCPDWRTSLRLIRGGVVQGGGE